MRHMNHSIAHRFFGDQFSNRRVLVTGHTGFKGAWLTEWLLRLGADVCGYSNGTPTNPSLFELAELRNRVRHVEADIRDLKSLVSTLKDFKPDFVFHLAAQPIVSLSYLDPIETTSVNVLGTATMLQALRECDLDCVAVIITSDKCYENVEWVWGYRENDRLGGKDIYSASKGAAELIFHAMHNSFFQPASCPTRLATARAGNVIGGGDWAPDRIIADCIRSWSRGEAVEIRSPNATRPWQHVLEPLSGYLTLAAKLQSCRSYHGESFNFGPKSEQNKTVKELLLAIATHWGFANIEDSLRITQNSPFHEAGLLKLNCDKSLLLLGWTPNLSYDECVAMTGEWYRSVAKEHGDASSITLDQITYYEDQAVSNNLVWQRSDFYERR